METVRVRYHKQEWQVPSGQTVRVTLESLGIDPLAVVALRDRKPVRDDALVESGDEIKVVNMVSGG